MCKKILTVHILLLLYKTLMAQSGLSCADLLIRNYTLTLLEVLITVMCFREQNSSVLELQFCVIL